MLIGGHLDSWHSAPGATDNADGAAVDDGGGADPAALGAQAASGRSGSRSGAAKKKACSARRRTSRSIWRVRRMPRRARSSTSYLNIDPGTGPVYGFYLQGQDGARSAVRRVARAVQARSARRRNVPESIGNTDHLSFTAIGLPGFNPIQDYATYDVRTHHTNMDTYERVRARRSEAGVDRVRLVRVADGPTGCENRPSHGRSGAVAGADRRDADRSPLSAVS